jgi:hypothetical protein
MSLAEPLTGLPAKKRDRLLVPFMSLAEPLTGLEPATCSLRVNCSTN